MKLRSFILGLGTGIVFVCVAIFFVYSLEVKRDAERELGVAMQDRVESPVPEPTVPAAQIPPKTESEAIPEPKLTIGQEPIQEKEVIQEPETVSESTPGVQDEEGYITIFIPPGSTATEISRLLFENGLVDEAEGFNTFIRDNKATTKLTEGNLKFPLDADYEKILEILKNKY